jgi:hypothetical protein
MKNRRPSQATCLASEPNSRFRAEQLAQVRTGPALELKAAGKSTNQLPAAAAHKNSGRQLHWEN